MVRQILPPRAGRVSGSLCQGRFRDQEVVSRDQPETMVLPREGPVKLHEPTGTWWLVAVLIVALVSACNGPTTPTPTPRTPAPPPPSSPTPPPSPTLVRYDVSGVVTDETGSPIANAEVVVRDFRGDPYARTSTDVVGRYRSAFDAGTTSIVALIHAGSDDYEPYVQTLPGGTADIVKNLRLRRIRTVKAGQSIVVSIDPDSSLAHDGEDWLNLDWVWEKFHVQVADSGTLTVDARPEVGGTVPFLAVSCIYVADNCRFDWVKPPAGSGSGSLSVKADSLFEMRLAIPSRMAPQRYEVATSLR